MISTSLFPPCGGRWPAEQVGWGVLSPHTPFAETALRSFQTPHPSASGAHLPPQGGKEQSL